ncbi:hypothetical protein G9A89_002327 [Geosiphon pyriformis]|nr:hypothetical protein G9A89_002327 [Geosiphon pyriformis]
MNIDLNSFSQVFYPLKSSVVEDEDLITRLRTWLHDNKTTFQSVRERLKLDSESSHLKEYACILGFFYRHGLGMNEPNLEKAFKYYRIAAENDNPFGQRQWAQVRIADLYFQGIGTREDIHKSLQWYRKAMENHSIDVYHEISAIFTSHWYRV